MTQNMMKIAFALLKAFNQDWIVNAHKTVFKACEEMIPLLND